MDRFVVCKGETKNTAVLDLVHHSQTVSVQKGTQKRPTGTLKPWEPWCKNKMLTKQTQMVKLNSLTMQKCAELLQAALLCCVSVGDCNPRISFLPMHSRFRRCRILPLICFGTGTGYSPFRIFPCGKNPRAQKSPPRYHV